MHRQSVARLTPPAHSPTQSANSPEPNTARLIAPSQGRASRIRPLISSGRKRHSRAAHQRRTRDVRNPLARPYAGWHHRYSHKRNRRSNPSRSIVKSISFLRLARLYLEKETFRASRYPACFAGTGRWQNPARTRTPLLFARRHVGSHRQKRVALGIAGGKWTTYRNMAQGLRRPTGCNFGGSLPEKVCTTRTLRIHVIITPTLSHSDHFPVYGSDAPRHSRAHRHL